MSKRANVGGADLVGLSDDQITNEWCCWMVEIRNQIWMLQLDDYLYRVILAVVQVNSNLSGRIFTIRLENSFYTNILLAIRKLADADKDVVSFQALFRQILQTLQRGKKILSRNRFVLLYDQGHFKRPSKRSSAGNALFDELVGVGQDFLDKDNVGHDRTELVRLYDELSSFVNDVLCHYNEQTAMQLRPGEAPNPSSYDYPILPPYTEIQNAIACLERLLKKYWMLLYANDDYEFPPLASDPSEIFKQPWIAGAAPHLPPSPDILARQNSNRAKGSRGNGAHTQPTQPRKREMSTIDAAHIQLDTEGVAWIDNTKVKVIEVVLDKLAHGSSPEEMHFQYPHLSLAQIHAALAYYYDHQVELDAEIKRRRQEVNDLAAQEANSPLRQRLRTLGKLP